jgi:ribose 5-phosphate isomerase B
MEKALGHNIPGLFFTYNNNLCYTTTMKIHLATDHAGFELKEHILGFLVNLDYEVSDHGAFVYNESDDYPDFVKKAAQAVASDPENNFGIIFGGSGQGEDMVADKFSGVRSAVYYGGNMEIVKLAREHNNANVLSLGARFLERGEAIEAVKLFLETPFSGDERHMRRIDKIED